MRRSWAPIAVGAVFLAVLGASFLLYKRTSEVLSPTEGYVLWARFKDASGLFEKSRVMTAGITVGQIEKKELDPEQPAMARIWIRMEPDKVVWSNAMVTKKATSLLGEFYLEIDPGLQRRAGPRGEAVENKRLGDKDQIVDVREPQGMSELLPNVNDVVVSIKETVPLLRDILKDVRKVTEGPVTQIAENVNDLITRNSEVLESLLERVDGIAADVQGVTSSEADNMKQAIRNIREITESIKGLVGTSDKQVTSTAEAVRDSVQKLQGTMAKVERTVDNLEKVSGKMARGEGTIGRLTTDDTLIRNVEEVAEEAGTFLKGVTRLQTIVGLRTEYNFLARTLKNYISVHLMPRPDKFYLIEIVDDPRGFREETTILTESSERGTVSEKQIRISEKLRFTLQFGKRIGWFTGRFGIKESTGGFGGDFHLLGNNKLLLSVDVFDVDYNVYPRVQARVAFSPYRNLHVIGGIDDFLNTRARAGGGGGLDYFFGAQLTFNDEDLKTLLLFGSGAVGAAATR